MMKFFEKIFKKNKKVEEESGFDFEELKDYKNDKLEKKKYGKMISRVKKEYGMEVKINHSPEKKMSQFLLDFAEPLLFDDYSNDETKRAVEFAIVVWNLSLYSKNERKHKIDEFVEKISVKSDSVLKKDILSLIKRKTRHFGQYKKIIVDYEITVLQGGQLRLSVTSTDSRK